MDSGAKAQSSNRKSSRAKHVSEKMAVVDESAKREVRNKRLEMLEYDNAAPETFGRMGQDDDDFRPMTEEEGAPPAKKKKGGRKHDHRRASQRLGPNRRGPRSLELLLMSTTDYYVFRYRNAAADPSRRAVERKFCSVCGFWSKYKCIRCSMPYCSVKCCRVHQETMCLKFAM